MRLCVWLVNRSAIIAARCGVRFAPDGVAHAERFAGNLRVEARVNLHLVTIARIDLFQHARDFQVVTLIVDVVLAGALAVADRRIVHVVAIQHPIGVAHALNVEHELSGPRMS